MTVLFLTAMGIGLTFLVLSLFVDHDHPLDSDVHDGPGIASLKVLSSWLAAFGGTGALATYAGWPTVWATLIACLGGVVLAAVMYGLLSLVYRQQSNSHAPALSLVGQIGRLAVSIQSNHEPGEVMLAQQSMIALSYSGGAIPAGSRVEVVNIVGDTAVVKPVA